MNIFKKAMPAGRQGFTLIELLVVIGILAVLMAGIVALIDPVDKNRTAQDAKVTSDVGQIATALQSFVAQSTDGNYPANLDPALVDAGELTVIPVQPGGGAYTYNGAGTDTVSVCGSLQSKKYVNAGTTFWVWDSSDGSAGASATCP